MLRHKQGNMRNYYPLIIVGLLLFFLDIGNIRSGLSVSQVPIGNDTSQLFDENRTEDALENNESVIPDSAVTEPFEITEYPSLDLEDIGVII